MRGARGGREGGGAGYSQVEYNVGFYASNCGGDRSHLATFSGSLWSHGSLYWRWGWRRGRQVARQIAFISPVRQTSLHTLRETNESRRETDFRNALENYTSTPTECLNLHVTCLSALSSRCRFVPFRRICRMFMGGHILPFTPNPSSPRPRPQPPFGGSCTKAQLSFNILGKAKARHPPRHNC